MRMARLVDADETLNHQIVATFASVAHTDPNWTEKVAASFHDLDTGYQIAFGFGKYVNRGIMDAYAGLALDNNQWAVRTSRELHPDPDALVVGRITYEVVEPFKTIRFALAAGGDDDLAFDITMHASGPPGIEDPWPGFGRDRGFLTGDVLRYHQCGVATGWFEHRGQRHELKPEAPAFRDHSWGSRTGIGSPRSDAIPEPALQARYRVWAPMLMRRADGTDYSLFISTLREVRDDGSVFEFCDSREELVSGVVKTFLMAKPRLTYDPHNGHLLGGTILVVDDTGVERPLTIRLARETGFHIGMGGYYGGLDDHAFGQWHGAQWEDYLYAEGTDQPDVVKRVHQTRDVLVEVDDPGGAGRGYALIETILAGDWEQLGLTPEGQCRTS